MALSTPTPHMAPLYIAKDKRFYEKYGLDVQLILVNSGSLVAQMFQAGEIQITANAPASLVSLAATGEKLSFFLGLSNTSPFSVVTQPNLRRAEDFKGKKIGTARFGGSSHISALIALEHLGLDLKRDKIILIQTGVDPDRMVALENKAIDAGMLQRVATKIMTGKGFYNLLNMHSVEAAVPEHRPHGKEGITPSPIPKSSTVSHARPSKPTPISSRKRTNSRSRKLSPEISACAMSKPLKISTSKPRTSWTANPIRPWKVSRSSSNTSPNKTPKPPPSKPKRSSTAAG